ncbi:type II toxin-antitoxin system VapC family toxin [Candidatus Bathyarchaeota archaeon]|nr:type II toxin-antitoxin system VapC family toxin [Candidatus Bathyarchaeota archaeon]
MVEAESYVDINVFIYWLGNHPEFGETSYRWIEKIEKSSPGKYVTSALTLYETIVVIAGLTGGSLKDNIFVMRLIEPITSLKGLVIEPLRLEDLTRGVNLMREYRLDYEDSLHLATALRKNVKEIISNDRDFDKTNLSRIF